MSRTTRGRGDEPRRRSGARGRLPVHSPEEEGLSVQILTQPLAGSRLVQEYLRGAEAARAFYAGAPEELGAFQRKLEEVSGRFGRAEREAAAAALRPVSPGAHARLARFVEEGGAVVTTGQQTGFLGGPLYTVHKALTVVRLADALEAALGVPVVPVFWMASEDHDWDEVNHAFLAAPRDGVERVQLPGDADLPLPMSERVVEEGVGTVLDEVAQVIAGGVFADDAMKWIRDAYAPGRSVAAAFADVVERLLARFDVCLVDAADPAVKRLSVPVLGRALEDAEEIAAALRRRTAALEEAGFHGQVGLAEGATTVFHRGAAGRVRLDRSGNRIVSPAGDLAVERAQAAAAVAAAPTAFSPNALLRPVIESAVFPTLAYAGGPAELAYFAQAQVLFAHFGILPPVAYPRASVLLLERSIERLVERTGFTLADMARPQEELATEVGRRAMPEEIEATLAGLGRSVTEGYGALIELAASVDPTLQGALGRLRNEILARIGDSERRLVRAVKSRQTITLEQLERARANLYPLNQPQERVLNVFPFLARYGPELLERIAEAIEVPFGRRNEAEPVEARAANRAAG